MKDVLRLTEREGTPFERRLLESAGEDASPPGSMSRVAARLGLELGAAPLQRSSQGEGSVAAEAGVKASRSGALLKYTLIAILCGSPGGSATSDAAIPDAAGLVSVPMAAESRELESSKPGTSLATEPLRTAADDVVHFPAGEARPQLRAPAQSVHSERAPRRRGSAPLPSLSAPELRNLPNAPPADSLLAEVQKLDRVRAALAAFQSQTALGELDEYDQSFPHGKLALEAIVLRVQALRSAGQFAPASRLARDALELPGIERYRTRLARLIEAD